MIIIFITLAAASHADTDNSTRSGVCLPGNIDGPLEKESQRDVRFATFNVSLNRSAQGDLTKELASSDSAQISAVAEIIQRTRPDVLLLNEFDYDSAGEAIRLFQKHYLGVSQNEKQPIHYPYVYLAEPNTGIPSGLDLDNDGSTTGPGDAFGFGIFPGQYGMVLLSKHPILKDKIRTFQKFLWQDMPDALIPEYYYSDEELKHLRLSSKSHWDIPISVNKRIIHILAAHPTPPVFDGPEDRNGRRNHDEIRFWADYVGGGRNARYIYDDSGEFGGMKGSKAFVIVGDYNADPEDGDSTNNAILQLLNHRAIDTTLTPGSVGGREDSKLEGQSNGSHTGNAALDTGDFNPAGPGNLRIDYVLPSHKHLTPKCGGVFWPQEKDTTRYLVGNGFPTVSSDHRLVWLDIFVSRRYW